MSQYLYTLDELLAMAARPSNAFACECGRLWHTVIPGLSVPIHDEALVECRHSTLRPAYITEEAPTP